MIETNRLILREWKTTDKSPFVKMNQDPEVMKYFPGVLSIEEVDQLTDRIKSHFSKWGYGFFAVELKKNGEFIGFIGLGHPRFESSFTPCVEIGWRLSKASWNQGYATAGAKAVLYYAFTKLNLSELYSFTPLKNKPSYRVMEKIGMNRIGEFEHPNVSADSPLRKHHIYYISKDTNL